jgi:hypothetical protein
VRNGEKLHRVKEQRNIIHTVNRRKGNWIAHSWRKKCILKHAIEGKLEVMGRQERIRKQLLNGFNKKQI